MLDFLSGILEWILNDWRERRIIFLSETTGLITGVGSSLVMSFMLPEPDFYLVYTLYTINAVAGITSACGRRSVSNIIMNVVYLINDVFGIYKLIKSKKSSKS
jgi:hypothetical protein